MAKARRAKLTQKAVDGLTYRTQGPQGRSYGDDALPGFGVRVYPSGKKAYVLYYGPSAARKIRHSV